MDDPDLRSPRPLTPKHINKHESLTRTHTSRYNAMGLFAIVKRLYSLDTLDTRFTTASRTPPRETRLRIDPAQPSSSRAGSSKDEKESKNVVERSSESSASRWRTPEFFVYYFAFITVVPMMFKVTYDVSKGSPL